MKKYMIYRPFEDDVVEKNIVEMLIPFFIALVVLLLICWGFWYFCNNLLQAVIILSAKVK